jgi:flagellin
MSLFSVNTNLGAMAALKSLEQTQNMLTNTQNQISTGLKVSSAADSPAVYAITQAMDGQIAGLSAVSDNLSFAAQVVGTASASTQNISSTLSTLKQTLTLGQTQGLSQTQMNDTITAALQQIDSFANSATMNGVNLVAGATGNGVTDTQLNVLTDTQGDQFAVGGSGAQAMNATSTGLGLSGLSVTSNDVQLALGTDSAANNGTAAVPATLGSGLVLVADGTSGVAAAALPTGQVASGLAATAAGQATNNTAVTLQTTNFGATNGTQTAQNPGQQTVAMLTDGSLTATQDIMNELNNLASVATGGTAATVAAAAVAGSAAGIADSTAGTGSAFTINSSGQITLVAGQTNGSITDLGNGSTQYTYVLQRDGDNNPIQEVSVIAANVGNTSNVSTLQSLTSGSTGTLATALDGSQATNNTAAVATRQAAIGVLTSALNAAGFNASVDANNNLTVSGNNLDTTGPAGATTAVAGQATVSNLWAGGAVTVAGAPTATATIIGVQQADASAAISNVDAAITKLGTISSAIGTATQHITGMQTFTSSLSSALTAGVGALTDADMATESAQLQSLQTKQQLGIQALSIANQQPQVLLKLFGG